MPPALIQQARNVELQRLQEMHRTVWEDALTGDREAIGTVLRLMERRAKLLGLDAPAKIDADLTITKIERVIVKASDKDG